MRALDRTVALATALVLAGLGFLPVANWIPGGHQADWYGVVAGGWLSGTAIVVGLGVVLGIVVRKYRSAGVPEFRGAEVVIVAAAFGAYCWVALTVFSGKPLLIDEIIQLFQARVFASGRLWLPAPAHPEFTSAMHLIDTGGRVYGQFPAGGPAMMVPAVLLGREWLTGPLFGAASVALFAAILPRIEPRPGVRLGALLLFALAPFALFMSGSQMNHVTVLTWILLGVLGLVRITADGSTRFRDGLWCGLGFGVAATIRPVDALAFALPAGLWLLARAFRRGRWANLIGAGIGVALPVAALLWVNQETTGAALRFGYTVMWGSAHDLGFHATPWGEVHTPARGLELVNLYLLRLQSYFLEAPVPGLLPAVISLGLTRTLTALDRYLLAVGALLLGAYFAYWHDGFYLGPRFVYPLLPFLALWTARMLPLLRERLGPGLAGRSAGYASAVAVLMAVGSGIPLRLKEYRNGMLTQRWDADRAAEAAGVRNAVVLVRESWGAQVMTRLWAAGVPRSDAEQFYRRIGTCELDQLLTRLEGAGVRGPAAVDSVRRLLADSGRVIKSTVSPDPTERLTNGAAFPPVCQERLRENWQGFTTYGHLILAGRNGNLFAKDLHERDSLLLREYPGRPVYLLRPKSVEVGAVPVFERIR